MAFHTCFYVSEKPRKPNHTCFSRAGEAQRASQELGRIWQGCRWSTGGPKRPQKGPGSRFILRTEDLRSEEKLPGSNTPLGRRIVIILVCLPAHVFIFPRQPQRLAQRVRGKALQRRRQMFFNMRFAFRVMYFRSNHALWVSLFSRCRFADDFLAVSKTFPSRADACSIQFSIASRRPSAACQSADAWLVLVLPIVARQMRCDASSGCSQELAEPGSLASSPNGSLA